MSLPLPCQIVDGFLPANLHNALLAYTLANECAFSPTAVWDETREVYDPELRLSWQCDGGLGPLENDFTQAIEGAMPGFLASLGMRAFPIARFELELVAHREGSFFVEHVDTLTGKKRDFVAADRVLSMAYYFHALPRAFAGGDIIFPAAGPFGAMQLEACDNRLVAFPSFMPHEVLPVACPPGNAFADARFAINCWAHRDRSQNQTLR